MAIRKNIKNEILASFTQKQSLYKDLTSTISNLLRTLLENEGITLHTLTSRCKDHSSLEGKLNRPEKSYKCLEDITDICGIRLTTYFSTDVDLVAKILKKELDIDVDASVDKRIHPDPNRFGYLSLHFVAKLKHDRAKLAEYKRYADLKFEIQIRSILQHAWAEIEHDLGYKSESGIPSDIRRRFARIAGLLELADSEFCGIREQLNSYENKLPHLIEKKPENVLIDLPTIRLLIEKDDDIIQLDKNIENATRAVLIDDRDIGVLSTLVDKLKFLNILNVSELQAAARENLDIVEKFARYWVQSELGEVSRGIGLFYLCYVLVWKSQDEEVALEYLHSSNIDTYDNREDLAEKILAFDPNLD